MKLQIKKTLNDHSAPKKVPNPQKTLPHKKGSSNHKLQALKILSSATEQSGMHWGAFTRLFKEAKRPQAAPKIPKCVF